MKNRILPPTSWRSWCRPALVLLLLLLLLLAGRANAQAFASWQFAKALDQTTGGGTSVTRATAVDPASGAVYVTGQFTGDVTFGTTPTLTSAGNNDVFVARYDPVPGTWAWARSAGGNSSDIGNGIATDGTNVYVTGTAGGAGTFAGQTLTARGGLDVFIAAYSASGGADVWARGDGSTNTDQSNAIATDGTNVYIVGTDFNGTSLQGQPVPGRNFEGFVAAYTASSGGNVWAKGFGGSASGLNNGSNDTGTGIATDGTNVYITGTFDGSDVTVAGQALSTTGGVDVLVGAYKANSGADVWGRSAGGASTDAATAIATDGTNVYITGYFTTLSPATATYAGKPLMSQGNREDTFVAAYTANFGGNVWARSDGGNFNDRGQGIATDGRGVYVSGYFIGTASFAGQNLTSTGNNEVFVAGYTATTGGNVGARSAGGNNTGTNNNDIGTSLDTDGANLYVGGQVYLPGNPKFDAITLTGTNPVNGFLAGLVVATPVLTSVLPTNGPVGTSVTLTGSGFVGTTGVSFNGTATTFTVNSGIRITVTVPVGATTGNVTVSNGSGPSNGVLFTVTTTPAVTTATPTNVTTTTATLGGTVVSDGSTPVTERGVVYVPGSGTPTTADTKLTAPGTTGAFTVSATGLLAGTQYTVRAFATNVNGTSYGNNVSFTTAAAAPTLTSLNPTSGAVGTSVTLTGTGFTGATGVSFNGTAATTFSVANATTATATVPTGATTGNVTITTPGGTSNGVAFTVTTVACVVTARAQNVSVTLNASGTASITAAQVNNGSSSTCGPVTLSVSPSTFTCADATPDPATNTALAFDGINQYAEGTNTLLPQGNTARTLEAWVYRGGGSGFQSIFNYGTGSINGSATNQRAGLLLNTSGQFYYAGESNDLSGGAPLPLNTWSHVAATFNGTTLTLYVNGTQVAMATKTFNTTGTTWRMARRALPNLPPTTSEYYNGRLDEVRVWSRALSAAEVAQSAARTNPASRAGLVARWDMHEGSGSSLGDVTGNSAPGTLYNAPTWVMPGIAYNDGVPVTLTVTDANGNTATAPASVTVTAPPTATLTGLSPNSAAPGATITATGTNLSGLTALTVNGASTAFSNLTATGFTFVVPAGATPGTGNVVLSLPCTQRVSQAFTVMAGTAPSLVINTPQSVPAGTYQDITVQNGGLALLQGDITVLGMVLVQAGGVLQTNYGTGCAIVRGPGNFVVETDAQLSICSPQGISASGATGNIQVTGTRTFASLASYNYDAAVAQVTGTGLPTQVAFLTLYNPTSVSLSQPTAIIRQLSLYSAGNIDLNGQALTLLSNAAGTALVVNGSTGVVIGMATVQRYIDPSLNAGLGYRHYSAPVQATTVADLATSGFSPEISQAATYNTSATPGTTSPFPTVFGYDQSRVSLANSYAPFDRGYVVPASLATPLVVGQGYTVNIAGNQLVDFTGTLNNGTLPLALAREAGNADAGWQLLGNPYPAPLDLARVADGDRLNLDGATYVYSSTSQYLGQYRSYVNGVGGNPVLPVAQGFFARVSAGKTSGSFTFRNSQRLTAPNATPFQRGAADARPLVQLDLRGTTGPAEAFYAYAQAGATPAFDAQFDAEKIANPTGLNLSSTATSGQRLAIDGRPVFDAATVLPLNVGVPAAGTYSFAAVVLNNLPAGLDAYLSDAQTGQTVNLRTQPAYTFSVTAAQATALLVGRFVLRFTASALATAPALTAAQVELYPNPARARFAVLMPGVAGATAVQAELVNALGQIVARQSAALPASGATLTVETGELAVGVYTLRLRAGPTTLAKRVVIQ